MSTERASWAQVKMLERIAETLDRIEAKLEEQCAAMREDRKSEDFQLVATKPWPAFGETISLRPGEEIIPGTRFPSRPPAVGIDVTAVPRELSTPGSLGERSDGHGEEKPPF